MEIIYTAWVEEKTKQTNNILPQDSLKNSPAVIDRSHFLFVCSVCLVIYEVKPKHEGKSREATIENCVERLACEL